MVEEKELVTGVTVFDALIMCTDIGTACLLDKEKVSHWRSSCGLYEYVRISEDNPIIMTTKLQHQTAAARQIYGSTVST
jgi:hypothetical protein